MGFWRTLLGRLRGASPADDLKRAGTSDEVPYLPAIPYPTADFGERVEPPTAATEADGGDAGGTAPVNQDR